MSEPRWKTVEKRLRDQVAELEAEIARLTASLADAGRHVDAWTDTAAQHCRNEEYYRGLVIQIGEALPLPDAYISDDGSAHDTVLCAKVPELVRALVAREAKAREDEREACAMVAEDYNGDGHNPVGDSAQLGDAFKTMCDIAAAIRARSQS
jgi:hypothetical protein